MTASIERATGTDAYALIYDKYLSMRSMTDRDAMYKFMTDSSHVWIGRDDNKVLGVWGLVPPTLMSDRAYLWLYHTEEVPEHSFIFIRHSQRAVEEMLRVYPLIVGHTIVNADRSIRWLQWLGAKFGTPNGELIPFEIRAKHG